jgi:hypothetical protein
VLSFSREEMDRTIDLIGGWKSLNRGFYYTDTDSMVLHSSQLPFVEKRIGKELGMLDFDVKGKIVKYVCLSPKEYMFVYVRKDGRVVTHKRTKGIPKSQWPLIGYEDFKKMLLLDASKTLTDSEENEFFHFRRIGFGVANTLWNLGIRPLGILIERMTKVINRTGFDKRLRVVTERTDESGEFALMDQDTLEPIYDHRADYGSVPVGYERQPDPYEEPGEDVCEVDAFRWM